MENLDPGEEQQVWQRVFARQEEPAREDLRGLLLGAMELAAVYRNLAQTFTGKARERVKQLYEGEAENIACLKGIARLSGRGEEVLKVWNPTREPAAKALEKCYHRTRRAMIEYATRSAEAEFGTVFQKLADREGKHCVVLAVLLGGRL